jgi:hypothetical protein
MFECDVDVEGFEEIVEGKIDTRYERQQRLERKVGTFGRRRNQEEGGEEEGSSTVKDERVVEKEWKDDRLIVDAIDVGEERKEKDGAPVVKAVPSWLPYSHVEKDVDQCLVGADLTQNGTVVRQKRNGAVVAAFRPNLRTETQELH